MLLFSVCTILFGSVCGAVVVSHFIVQVFQKYPGQSLILSINCCLKLLLFSLSLACSHHFHLYSNSHIHMECYRIIFFLSGWGVCICGIVLESNFQSVLLISRHLIL